MTEDLDKTTKTEDAALQAVILLLKNDQIQHDPLPSVISS
jgi:hypothetical protein